MKQSRVGLWIWGAATVLLALACLCIVFLAGLSLSASAQFSSNVPARLPGLYLALKENGVLVAGLVGVSALCWVLYVRGNRAP